MVEAHDERQVVDADRQRQRQQPDVVAQGQRDWAGGVVRIAAAGAADRSFSIPVYDGVRRFDVVGRILPKGDQTRGLLKVEL
ncbi:MAG: hypothetical protein WB710_04010, partial [Stellaceae bacterium]